MLRDLSNQLVSAKLFDGKKNTTVTYTYDDNGNLISEISKYGTDQVETYYDYTVEKRLQAVYDVDRLLMARRPTTATETVYSG